MSSVPRMERFHRRLFPFLLLGFIIVGYQNCGELERRADKSQTSVSPDLDKKRLSEAPGLYAANADETDVVQATPLYINITYTLRVGSAELQRAAMLWSIPANANTGTCVLGEMPDGHYRTLKCTTPRNVTVNVAAILEDGSVRNFSLSKQVSGTVPTGTPDPDIYILFNIAAGTGTQPWNAAANPIKAFVGQTIRFTNMDTVNHQLRTAGAPCATQAAPMANGAFFDCVVTGEHAANAVDTYDNIAGPGAVVYIQTISGDLAYANTCQGCHGTVDASVKRGRSFNQIRAAITAQPAMQAIVLSDDQVRAIVFALSH